MTFSMSPQLGKLMVTWPMLNDADLIDIIHPLVSKRWKAWGPSNLPKDWYGFDAPLRKGPPVRTVYNGDTRCATREWALDFIAYAWYAWGQWDLKVRKSDISTTAGYHDYWAARVQLDTFVAALRAIGCDAELFAHSDGSYSVRYRLV